MARPLSMPMVAGWMKQTTPCTKKTTPVNARRSRANRLAPPEEGDTMVDRARYWALKRGLQRATKVLGRDVDGNNRFFGGFSKAWRQRDANRDETPGEHSPPEHARGPLFGALCRLRVASLSPCHAGKSLAPQRLGANA